MLADIILRTPIPWGVSYRGHTLYGLQLKRRLGYEEETARFYERHLKPGDIVADVGASNGLYTFMFSRAVGPTGTVIAFEPDARSFKWLAKGARKSSNVRLEQKGVGEKKEYRTLWGKKLGHGMNSMAYRAGPIGTDIEVMDLSSYENERSIRFDWVKIDVEGAELDVLRGMRKARATVEFAPENLWKVGILPEEFLQTIEAMGYAIYFINEDGGPVKKSRGFLVSTAKRIGVLNLYIVPDP